MPRGLIAAALAQRLCRCGSRATADHIGVGRRIWVCFGAQFDPAGGPV